MDSQIADICASCLDSFRALWSAVQSPKRDIGDQMPLKDVASEMDRLILWANSWDAVDCGHPYEHSLDYRLSKSPFYRERVCLSSNAPVLGGRDFSLQ